MLWIKLIINTILIILFIGCGDIDVNENNQTEKIEPLSTTSVVTTIPSSTPTPMPTIINTPTPTIFIGQESTIENEETIKSTDEPSQIDNILLNTPIVENSSTPSVNDNSNINNSSNNSEYKEKFINNNNCNQIIDKEFLVICYDYKLKEAKSVAYTLEGDLVNELNIKDRPSFYQEELIEEEYRAKSDDYSGSGYDRGHLAPDASFDWSIESLEATYSLANIIPQVPIVNREMWVKVEQYARDKAVELGRLDVVNVVKFSIEPKYIGDDNIAISMGYYKILYNQDKGYNECFYYANDINSSSLDDNISVHSVNCGDI